LRTLAQEPKATQQTEPARSANPNLALFGQSRNTHPIPHLQRTIGGQAAQPLLQAKTGNCGISPASNASPEFGHKAGRISACDSSQSDIQTKLEVNAPGDTYEQEADSVANQVMSMPGPRLQRTCTCAGSCSKCQSQQSEHEHDLLLTKRTQAGSGGSRVAPPVVHDVLSSTGQPLEAGARAFFEPRFGHDFSQVRVHTGTTATAAAQAVNARAFTVGKNIVFGAGGYQPQTPDGKRLLAHELAHTIQQGAATPTDGRAQVDGRESQNGTIAHQHIANAGLRVQRQGEDLRATRFSGNRILEQVFDGTTVVSQRRNRTGTHVRLIQESLLAQGYALPLHGADGNFGPETEAAVRAFQVDAGAVDLDGIVGPETMHLLDMHDPGGTTGVAGPFPAAATATFSESAIETFAGYDASTAPDWLVVPVGGRRRADVAITPAGARPTYASDTPAVATVHPTTTGIAVTGVSAGTARIQAQAGATVLDTLRVSVKDRRDRSVAFHYVCDSRPAAAGGPHCSNGRPSADVMRSLLNRVWERQANVRFTGGASHNIVVPGDMGPYVNDDGFGGDEMGVVTAAAPAPADYNVFRVWHVRLSHGAVNNALNNANNTLIGDSPCADGWGLPHEAGHFLGLGHGAGFIMTPCGARADQRVSKAMADTVNP
jgi:peptidoglycan hydrolase-like protein with peptidoglycan-binding domain